MADQNLTFAKIVANPSEYSWSQAYNAGKLFAVLSLESKEETKEKDYLNVLGKEVLDTLEQEFFTLETKDLESIKKAVLETSVKIPQDINLSFVIGTFVNNVLYVYILGNGKVSLKRNGHLGNLLESSDQKADSFKSASGFLEDGDVVLLQTKQFANIISATTLSEFLDNLSPHEAAENIAPLVHEKEEPGAAAIIINYTKPLEEIEEPVIKPGEEKEEVTKQEPTHGTSPFYSPTLNRKLKISGNLKSIFTRLKLPKNLEISHSRKVILTIVVVIIIVFAGSVVFAIKKQQDTKIQTLFSQIYPQALKEYEQGQGLLDLNQNLARDSFSKAQKLLESGGNKFPKNSKEEKQILELLAKVNTSLQSSSGVQSSNAKEVSASQSFFLSAELKNTAIYFSYDDKNIYGLTSDNVYSLDTNGQNKKEIIKNDNDWKQGVAIFPYFSNLYILDKKQNQILKYVATSSGFSKANYLGEGVTPNFSNAISMAIDSSIYVLSTDGKIVKFTKGKLDNFSVTGLDTAFSNPTKIYANVNDDNIYVLDNGNSRVVILDKNGTYKAQYKANVIKAAKDFDVFEKDKKIFVLSSEKIYQIDLK
nr:hypothetical protein [Candidatus Levybacteria bacterium]